MAPGTLVAIDVGSSKICAAIANTSSGRITDIVGVGHVPSRGVQKGIIIDIDDATAAIRHCIETTDGSVPRVNLALAGFGGKRVTSSNPTVSVETARRGHLVGHEAMEEAYGKVRSLPLAQERVPLNIVKRQWAIDHVGGIRNPLGMHGSRLDLEAHVVASDYGYVENLSVCLERAGIPVTPGSLVATPLAAAEAALEPEDRERGVILADTGGGTTGIAVFRDGSIWHTSILPVGGRNITNDLAVALSIPFSSAEDLKVKCGRLYPEEANETEMELIRKHGTTPEEISYIIRARMEEIIRMVVSKSPYVPNSMVITGGTANLPGIDRFACEVLGFQVRIGIPVALPEGGQALNDPAFAVTAGLLQWGAEMTLASNGHAYGEGGSVSFISGLQSTLASFWNAGWRPRISFRGPRSE